MLALNQSNGSFADAHGGLLFHGDYFSAKADEFINYYFQRAENVPVTGVFAVPPMIKQADIELRWLALYDLWNVVAWQVIRNIAEDSRIDPAFKPALLQGMRQAAQFQRTSSFAETERGERPAINPLKPNFYSNSLLGTLPCIIVPPEYRNDIPNGI
jgi:hypothetical protein